jgi:hypothetical protein
MFSRDQLKRAATLTKEDFVQRDNVALYGHYIPRSEAGPSAPALHEGRP